MVAPFQPARADGRSDRRVVYELAKDADPETMFPYDDIFEALQEGLDEAVDKTRVYRAVGVANKDLLREQRRYLRVVAGRGYRVLRADEHLPVALAKKATAEVYIKRGLQILEHARDEELTETQRVMNRAQIMILGGIYQAVQASQRRHDRQERVIAQLSKRLERLEGSEATSDPDEEDGDA